MTALSLPMQRSAFGLDSRALPRFVTEMIGRQPALAGTGFVILAAMAPTLFAHLVETRTLYDINVWTKPLKFEASVALYFLTLAWFWGYLSPQLRGARSVKALALLIAACGVFEIVYIGIQASRGVGSHFNTATQLESMLFNLMGIAAVIMTLGSLVLAILIARSGVGTLSPVFRASVIAGLFLTFVLGTGAGIVIALNGGHWVGAAGSDVGGLPIFGWERDAGDLRVAHFFGIHAMQVLPVFALLAERLVPRRVGAALAVFTRLCRPDGRRLNAGARRPAVPAHAWIERRGGGPQPAFTP